MAKKTPLTHIVLCLIVLTLAGVAALAVGPKRNIVTSADGRMAIATKAPSVVTPAVREDAGLTTIAGNLSDFPFGIFFCCYGNTITGSGSSLGFELWEAIPFTPSSNISVKKTSGLGRVHRQC